MEGKTITKIDNDDRISELPDSVAHHILSFLVDYPAELIRTSLLSKRWFALTASSPILAFNDEAFPRAKYRLPGDRKYAKDIFFSYVVGYTTCRFSQQQYVVSADSFKLFASLQDPAHVDTIERCLGFILKQGLWVFTIFNRGINLYNFQQPPPMYRLPDKLLSVSSLTSLSINNCELPSSLMADDDVVKVKSLKVFHSDGVYLNEKMIKCLTAGCPLLEKFNIYRCYGFKRLCVYGLHDLQTVGVYYMSALEEIDIQSPNLAYIDLFNMSNRDKLPYFNLFSCQKLSMIFQGLFSYYARWSTVHRSIRDSGGNHPIRDSGELKTCMVCCPDFDADTSWFRNFRLFLNRTVRFKVLKLHISVNFIDVEELKLLELSPFELEHIELSVNCSRDLSEYLPVMDAVLWCFRPRSLTLMAYFYLDNLESLHMRSCLNKKIKANFRLCFPLIKPWDLI